MIVAALVAAVSCNLFNNKKGNAPEASQVDSVETVDPVEPEEEVLPGVDLGLSVRWAECNLGASTPEEYGDYFAWGEVETHYVEGHGAERNCTEWKEGKEKGHKWSTYKWSTRNGPCTKYGDDGLKVLQPADDAASVILGGKWRIPTFAEMKELNNKCKWAWDNTRKGYTVTGPNGNSIFLPAAGYRFERYLMDAGKVGTYWSSSVCEDGYTESAGLITFRNDDYGVGEGFQRFYGITIRPVTD